LSFPRLRILHILRPDAGGLSRYVVNLAGAMRSLGHDVTVAGEPGGASRSMFDEAQIPYVEIPLAGGPIALFKSAMTLKRHLRDHPADVIHTHYRRATLLARRIQSGGTPPILYTLHLSHISLAGLHRFLSDFGDHTHIASQDARPWLIDEARVPPEKITLVPHGIDVSKFPPADASAKRAAKRALRIDDNALVASYVGRFDYPKNEAWLLDLACATRAQADLHFILAGGGPNEPALRHRIDAENLHERVRLLGHQRDPLPIYQATDLLLLPSAREGFSYVCAEAMSAGVPVLRTRTTGTSELIIEGVTGRSVPIDHDAFLDAAVRMLADRASLGRVGAAASAHVREHFTFDKQLAATLDLYRRLARLEPR
jgi:glycosyltransferase involved in cell wall biosynthesis